MSVRGLFTQGSFGGKSALRARSEREAAVSLRTVSDVSGVWLPSLTLIVGRNAEAIPNLHTDIGLVARAQFLHHTI